MADLLDKAADALRLADKYGVGCPWVKLTPGAKERFRNDALAVARVLLTAPPSGEMLKASEDQCSDCLGKNDEDDPCGVGLCGVKCYLPMTAALLREIEGGQK